LCFLVFGLVLGIRAGGIKDKGWLYIIEYA